jgi:hypothetical protein
MTFTEAVIKIVIESATSMTPQEIRDQIKKKYPEYYETESQKNNVEKGHYQNIDHALTAQIYSLVRINDSFYCDKSTKPMKISMVNDDDEVEIIIEDYENEEGIVYVLKTNTFTKDGKEILKIGFTAQDIQKRIAQLYTTGVPFEFKVQNIYATKNFIELEQALHKLLDPFKINKSREFFTEDALPFINKIVGIHKEIQKAVL